MPLPPRTSPILDSNRQYIDRSERPSALRPITDWLRKPNQPPAVECARMSPATTAIAFWVAICATAIVCAAIFALR